MPSDWDPETPEPADWKLPTALLIAIVILAYTIMFQQSHQPADLHPPPAKPAHRG